MLSSAPEIISSISTTCQVRLKLNKIIYWSGATLPPRKILLGFDTVNHFTKKDKMQKVFVAMLKMKVHFKASWEETLII